MKKLLLILLCVPLITLFNSCSSSGGEVPTPILEDVIVDQIWEIKDGTERFYLNSSDGKLYTKDDLCDTFSVIGDWILDGDSLRFSYFDGPLFINQLFGVINAFSSTEISFLVDNSPTTQVNIIYQVVDEVIRGCIDPAATNFNPNALCDDDSCSYNVTIGETFQGGIVFYLDGNGGGLIAAPSDQLDRYWGINGTTTGAYGYGVGTGAQNTIDIVNAHSNEYFAATICSDLTLAGYSDWYLPSAGELNHMYLNIGQDNALGLGALGLGNVGGFAGTYWSSTESSTHTAEIRNFDEGWDMSANKESIFSVRAVRAF